MPFGFGKKKDEKPHPEVRQQMEQASIYIVNDERVDKRIKKFQTLHNLLKLPFGATIDDKGKVKIPEKYPPPPKICMEEIQLRMLAMDECVHTSASPWSDKDDALQAWNNLYALSEEGWSVTCMLIEDKKTAGAKYFLVELFWSYLKIEIFNYGKDIIDGSYRDAHVSPSFNIVLQNPMTPYGMGSTRAPEGKEDMAGQAFWEEYMKQQEARLRRLEEQQERRATVRGRT